MKTVTFNIEEMSKADLTKGDPFVIVLANTKVPENEANEFYKGFALVLRAYLTSSSNFRLERLCQSSNHGAIDKALAGHMLIQAAIATLSHGTSLHEDDEVEAIAIAEKLSKECDSDVVAEQAIRTFAENHFKELVGKDNPDYARGCFKALSAACSILAIYNRFEEYVSTDVDNSVIAAMTIIAAKRAQGNVVDINDLFPDFEDDDDSALDEESAG